MERGFFPFDALLFLFQIEATFLKTGTLMKHEENTIAREISFEASG
tara:strand:+ start:31 stop:168 length:138 start_codon:yes stop_codon:yes gene_type:complete